MYIFSNVEENIAILTLNMYPKAWNWNLKPTKMETQKPLQKYVVVSKPYKEFKLHFHQNKTTHGPWVKTNI